MVESENHDRSYYALIAKVAKLEAERSNLHVQMESLKSDAKAYQEVALEMDFRERKEPRQDCLFEGHRGLAVHVHRGTPGLGSGDDHIVEAASLSKVPPTLLAVIPLSFSSSRTFGTNRFCSRVIRCSGWLTKVAHGTRTGWWTGPRGGYQCAHRGIASHFSH